MVRRGSFIGGQDNLSVPDAPTIGDATVGDGQVSVAFTGPSDVGDDPITLYGASATDGTNVIGATNSASPVTITGLTNGTSYTARVWAINDYGNGPLSTATDSFSPITPSIAHYGASGDSSDAVMNKVEKVTIDTTGNFTDFNDLTEAKVDAGSSGSPTRTIFFGGYSGNIAQPNSTRIKIEYFDNTTTGNAVNFGDLSSQRRYPSGNINNNVRGIVAGGEGGYGDVNRRNIIEYVTMASTGDAIDFGDLTGATKQNSSTSSSTRGLSAGGSRSSGDVNVIDYITIVTSGNAVDFGDLGAARDTQAALASSTRAVFSGDRQASASNQIEYVTIASTGNATDFGDLTATSYQHSGAESSTRGIFIGGVRAGSISNIVDYITIANTGNATDFGDLTEARYHGTASSSGKSSVQNESYFAPASIGLYAGGTEPVNSVVQSLVSYINIATDGEAAMFGDLSAPRQSMFSGGMASSTRAVFGAGGISASPYYVDIIDFFTFSTKGKATDFGNATVARSDGASLSNSTRGLMAGGSASSASDVVDYITIASAGNATDFGDASAAYGQQGATAGTTRGLVAGGAGPVNTIDYYTIASTGNATDFGDLTVARRLVPAGLSSNTRAVFGGGNSGSASDVMDYVTIASTGNATDFGNLTAASIYSAGLSNKTQGLYTAWGSSGTLNVDKITIASTGNATDWGENIHKNYGIGSASNSHGGLS